MWWGRPAPGRSALSLTLLTGVCFVFGIVLLWGARSPDIGDPSVAHVARLVCGILGGLICVLVPAAWLQEYTRGRRTVYAVTDRRVATIVGGASPEVTDIRLAAIGRVDRSERPGARGDLLFIDADRVRDGTVPTGSVLGDRRDVAFVGIPEVEEVERRIMELRRPRNDAASSTAPSASHPAARFRLAPGEALLWSGRPLADYVPRALRRQLQFAMALVVVSGVLYFVAPRFEGERGPLWQDLFFAGVGVLIAQLWRRLRHEAPPETYAVTDRRLIIAADDLQREVASFESIDPTHLDVDERADGVGELYFAREKVPDSSHARPIGFIGISNVRGVERLVRERFSRR